MKFYKKKNLDVYDKTAVCTTRLNWLEPPTFVLPIQFWVDLWVIVMKGTSHSTDLQNWSLNIGGVLCHTHDPFLFFLEGSTLLYNGSFATVPLAWWLECSPMARETWIQSQIESYQRLKKWSLIA